MELSLRCIVHIIKEILKPDNRVQWSNELKELKTQSINAYKMCLDSGKPRKGFIFQNKIKSYYDYKKAIIAAKNKAKYAHILCTYFMYIFSHKLLNRLFSKNANNFWSA